TYVALKFRFGSLDKRHSADMIPRVFGKESCSGAQNCVRAPMRARAAACLPRSRQTHPFIFVPRHECFFMEIKHLLQESLNAQNESSDGVFGLYFGASAQPCPGRIWSDRCGHWSSAER